jgi:hypothetical protein
VAPALRGAREGLDRVIAYADVLGAFATYLFAFAGLSSLVFGITLTFREKRFGPVYRVAASVLGVCVISLVAPAFREPLPERWSIVAALASGIVALMASREAIAVPRTRALGVLLVSAGSAALRICRPAWSPVRERAPPARRFRAYWRHRRFSSTR